MRRYRAANKLRSIGGAPKAKDVDDIRAVAAPATVERTRFRGIVPIPGGKQVTHLIHTPYKSLSF